MCTTLPAGWSRPCAWSNMDWMSGHRGGALGALDEEEGLGGPMSEEEGRGRGGVSERKG
jgi:hypothetical protein